VLLVVRTDPVVELDKNEVLFADVWYGTEYTVPFAKLVLDEALPDKFDVIKLAVKSPKASLDTIVEGVFNEVASELIVIEVLPDWLAVNVPEPEI
jgi:hypothetical protein